MQFEIYQDAAGEWRWRLVAGNGRIVADGGEGYSSYSNAGRAIDTFTLAVREAPKRRVRE